MHQCRTGMAVSHLEKQRRVHLWSHCQRCCHHSRSSADSQPTRSCGCPVAVHRVVHQSSRRETAHGTLSFLQPPCPAGMARERHPPFEWSLLMRAFTGWKICEAYWRPRTGAYAKQSSKQVSIILGIINILSHLATPAKLADVHDSLQSASFSI